MHSSRSACPSLHKSLKIHAQAIGRLHSYVGNKVDEKQCRPTPIHFMCTYSCKRQTYCYNRMQYKKHVVGLDVWLVQRWYQ